jgi:hypothetical protein
MKYFKDTREGKELHVMSRSGGVETCDLDYMVEINESEFLALDKAQSKKRKQDNQPIPIEYEDLDVSGLTIKTISGDHFFNIQTTEHYITNYKEDLELVELGEIAETSITVEQYRELLKLRNQWRKLL